MKNKKVKILKIALYFLFYLLPFTVCFSSCIRLTGGAGVWKQGSEDEEPVSHQASFDTANLIPSSNQNS